MNAGSATKPDVSFYGYVGVLAASMLLLCIGTVALMCLAGLLGINLFSWLRVLSVVMLGGFNLLLLSAAYDKDKEEKEGTARPRLPLSLGARRVELAGALLTLLACVVFVVACIFGIFGIDLFSAERITSTLFIFGVGLALLHWSET